MGIPGNSQPSNGSESKNCNEAAPRDLHHLELSKDEVIALPRMHNIPQQSHSSGISLSSFFILDGPPFQSWEGREKKKGGKGKKKAGDVSEEKLPSWQVIYEVLKSIFGAVIYLGALSLNKQRAPLPLIMVPVETIPKARSWRWKTPSGHPAPSRYPGPQVLPSGASSPSQVPALLCLTSWKGNHIKNSRETKSEGAEPSQSW